jgi:hypothetical protein
MSAGEVVVFFSMIWQTIWGTCTLLVQGAMKFLEGFVGRPAATAILAASGLGVALLILRGFVRMLTGRRRRRIRELNRAAW